MWSNNAFDKKSGPGTTAANSQQHGFPSSSSSWFNIKPQVPPPIIPSQTPEAEFPHKTQVQDLKRTRSPPSTLHSTYKHVLLNSTTALPGSHPVPQRTRSPPLIYQTDLLEQGFGPSIETKRPSVSPPKLNTRPNSHVWTPSYADLDKPDVPATNLPVPKRSRFPFSTNPGLRGNNLVHDDTERELQAKAKRLARFKDELSQPETNDLVDKYQKPQQFDQLGIDKNKSMGEAPDIQHLPTDGDDQDSSAVIIGYCPNMCPEQERAERERKGDLDQYERLDGNRNRTTESLAVKKYTRTAEREALLIRPMEILQKTMEYLLNLLNQPYDDRFLGLYNFLWDRMRAIRMDLRMQHIFNLGAITMLEQMIRLHIIAMHELCQYTKGEGFSEGFDAHLNIEQMNKTSVELFQLYDDHRKKGIEVPTEREFRGYYALLKLDKHPGYKVEPSELSLDLAKMTPGIRQAAEVMFARDVARACRTGNFIAFFRLVRRASYLQACLMHAHFGKLRTQALASLHSGLQNNQGLPVGLVAKWLGMEDENMEDLLEYHGFSIKDFEEPYMVKERQFLNSNTESPLKCSKLVHLKRSSVVVDDVFSSPSITSSMPPEFLKRVPARMASMQEESPVGDKEKAQIFTNPNDSHMTDFGGVSFVKNDMRLPPVFITPVVAINRWTEDHSHMEVVSPSPRDTSPRDSFKHNNSFKSPEVVTSVAKPSFDKSFRNSLMKNGQSSIFVIPPQVTPTEFVEEALPDVQMDSPVEDLVVHSVIFQDPEPEEPKNAIQEVPNEIDTSVDKQVAEAKLKLILRQWRRRAFIKKDLRDKKRLAATTALSSLSLGPPMRHYKKQLKVPEDFNIDRAMCARYDKQEHLWSTLNVSNVVAATLGERYQYHKCICWKLLFCSFDLEPGSKFLNPDPGSWFRHKLMPENVGNSDGLVASLPGLSIWKIRDSRKLSSDPTHYLSVVRDVQFDNLVEETVLGACAVIFLASDCISWESQKISLHNLVSFIPYGSCVPLLIYSGSDLPSSTIVQNLGLNEVENSKIGCFSVVPLDEAFTIEHLTKGLEWLASQSPVQPMVSCVKTRELVLTHLNISVNMLVQFNSDKKRPDQYISAINEALDESVKDICNAAKSNPICWPCPEISLLNEPECTSLEPYLPSFGWSSASRIEPLIQALRNCKLPSIQSDISWGPGVDIESQRLQLENFLVSYLIPLMGSALAQKEASILIQNFVGLELRGSTYYLVPKWLMIFRRVFNWQLMSLSDRRFSSAYILEQQHKDFLSASVSLEDESYNLSSPSLDEMIAVSCSNTSLNLDSMDFKSNDSEAAVCDAPELELVVSGDDTAAEEEEEERRFVENERSLSRMLEQCNILQDSIDKKLSVYF